MKDCKCSTIKFYDEDGWRCMQCYRQFVPKPQQSMLNKLAADIARSEPFVSFKDMTGIDSCEDLPTFNPDDEIRISIGVPNDALQHKIDLSRRINDMINELVNS